MNAEQIGLLATGGVLGAYLLLLVDIVFAVIRERRTVTSITGKPAKPGETPNKKGIRPSPPPKPTA